MNTVLGYSSSLNPAIPHFLFETLAYAVGARLYFRAERADAGGELSFEQRLSILVGAVLGAAIGSKLSYWIDDPLTAFAHFPDPQALMQGKSIVGGLLGGLIGVEIAKRRAGVNFSTGDRFVLPLTIGMAIGRIGCHLAGPIDHTAGVPTTLWWGYDYGDGIPRHPTALYEIGVVLAIGWLATRLDTGTRGDRFRAFMLLYFTWRFAIDFLKPIPHPYLWLSGLQLLSLAAIGYYLRHLPRLAKGVGWVSNSAKE